MKRITPGQVNVNGMLAVSTRDRGVRHYLRSEYRHLRRVAHLEPRYARGALLRSLTYGAHFGRLVDVDDETAANDRGAT